MMHVQGAAAKETVKTVVGREYRVSQVYPGVGYATTFD